MARHNTGFIVTVNGGSSTVKLAVYTRGERSGAQVRVHVDRIGAPESVMTVSFPGAGEPYSQPVETADHTSAASALANWLEESGYANIRAIGHRVVHGGMHLLEHQTVTPDLISELRRAQCLDMAHLPREIALIEGFGSRYPKVPQVACFDTAFHRDLPRTAQLLPIPRRYLESGVRRLGFHGLSYTYLLKALRETGGEAAANGRVILAHLGSGASMAALRDGKPLDTTMAFTPAAGLMMATRPGDLDPGLMLHLMRTEKLSAEQMDRFISRQCGLAGVSDGTADVRELLQRREFDRCAAEALDLFCYTARKWLGAYMAVLGGLDTLVFSGGIGEHSAPVRAEICNGLEAFGLHMDQERNAESAGVISQDGAPVTVRVIPTDEEAVMAGIVFDLLGENL